MFTDTTVNGWQATPHRDGDFRFSHRHAIPARPRISLQDVLAGVAVGSAVGGFAIAALGAYGLAAGVFLVSAVVAILAIGTDWGRI